MEPSDFTQNKYGRLVKGTLGYWAYMPYPLAPDIDLPMELVRELSEADRALGELAGVARMLPNPHLLIAPFVRREAVLSSRIEGTQASISDLFFFEAAKNIVGWSAWRESDPWRISTFAKLDRAARMYVDGRNLCSTSTTGNAGGPG